MPKSKRGRHISRSKRKGKKTFTAPAAQAPVAAGAVGPTSVAEKPAPVPKPKAPVMVAEASNVAAELRRIGIVAGVIIVILIILALILA
jgi:hypothetical protein